MLCFYGWRLLVVVTTQSGKTQEQRPLRSLHPPFFQALHDKTMTGEDDSIYDGTESILVNLLSLMEYILIRKLFYMKSRLCNRERATFSRA